MSVGSADTWSSSLLMSTSDRSSSRRLITVEGELETEPLSHFSDSGVGGGGSSVVVAELVG